jgi:PRC-barrel domain
MTTTLWRYDDPVWIETDLVGYGVEALDGAIGKVDEASTEIGVRYLVVDTGPWIFGKKVMLPAGIVDRVDTREERVYVRRTKDEIKNAPEFDVKRYRDEKYRQELGTYYERNGMTRSSTRV